MQQATIFGEIKNQLFQHVITSYRGTYISYHKTTSTKYEKMTQKDDSGGEHIEAKGRSSALEVDSKPAQE